MMLKKLKSKDMKFLENWDPEKSTRERRKLTRKIYNNTRKIAAVYDENGTHIDTGLDVCDCFDQDCPGCHMPCPKCKSSKCGPDCRVNRKWMYEQLEMDGSDVVIKNPIRKN